MLVLVRIFYLSFYLPPSSCILMVYCYFQHHCRRCGGLFCNSCTQQRMMLRGQGDSPVRICEPCKKLEEAARFEMRYGHKSRAGKSESSRFGKSISSFGFISISHCVMCPWKGSYSQSFDFLYYNRPHWQSYLPQHFLC